MLTIFAVPKPFHGYIGIIQRNAIQSWLQLRPPCEIILFGDGGIAEVAAEFGIQHIPDVECNEYGTPLLSYVFRMAQDIASHKLMCYVNADIILMDDFLPAIRQIQWHQFLLVGRRWDIDLKEPVDFSDAQWGVQLRALLAKQGKLHAPSGIDYFVFPHGLYRDLPPFAVGRPGWDNWMVYRARSQKLPVIDATKALTVVHQNHDYEHHPGGERGVFRGPEAERSRELLGGDEYSLNINHATWILASQGLRRAFTLRHFYYSLYALPVLFPRLHFLGMPRRALVAISKAIRSALGIARE
jgi:hypothetical protein